MIALILALASAAPQDGATAPEPEPIDPARWISPNAYPASALRQNQQGLVSFTLDVNVAGRVTKCTITVSSGFAILDDETCSIMRSRGRFKPAKDASGVTVASTWNRFTWSIPR